MSEALSPYVLDATPGNFEPLIRGNSMKGLVLAHFWSPKAGPCLMLMPRLVRLAAEYGGRILLVMVNADELGRQARDLGVTSVPTVKFFLHGQALHTIHGAEPDSVFHEAIARFLAGEEDKKRMAALALHQAGRTGEAIEALARMAVEDPADLATALDLAKLLTLDGRADAALDLLQSLPAEARRQAEIAPLLAHLELLHAANQGPEDPAPLLAANPEEHEARLALAARALFENIPEDALQHLLELARRAPDWREDLGRRALLALFQLPGMDPELIRRYRAALAGLRV
jgi:putative thioredoxin